MQDKALAFGLYGAVVCRAIFVLLGAAVLESFKPVLLVFAALLIFTSGKILFAGDDEEDEDPAENAIVKFVMGQNVVPSTDAFDREDATKFFTECADGIKRATPLLTCVVCLELSDIVFAVDSVPAVFGVTRDPLIVYSSNLFAILGLRAWFGVLSKAAEELVYLEKSVALVLGFVGGKMVGSFFGYDISTAQSLGVVVSTLAAGVALSVLAPPETDDES
ncbi:integral membrane protein TerC [Pelagophyceae sp. CCMP2097]|nr:integral membrane protein TerC [Pelagophyceae sp. CCMP2097]